MINLKQVRVVNWHYFKDEIIRVGKLTLLSGKNGMGKSTLIDAIQYALAADLRKAKFNQAAGDRRGGRDLAGYVRCKIGSDSTEFLRGDTVAHVLLDFDMGKEHMTAAVCVEAYSDGRTSEHFWLGENFDIKTFEVKSDEGKVLSWRQCKEQLLARSCLFYESKREYLRYVTDRLGVYRRMSEYNPYLEAFTRSVSFTPLVSVDRFVCDYILEERQLDIQTMKENLESYKEAERQARGTEFHIAALRKIAELAAEYERLIHNLLQQDYLKHHIDCSLAEEDLLAARDKIKETEATIARLEQETLFNERDRARIDEELGEVNVALANDSAYNMYQSLQKRLELSRGEYTEAEKQGKRCIMLRKQALEVLHGLGALEESSITVFQLDKDIQKMEAARSQAERDRLEAETLQCNLEEELALYSGELADLNRGILRFPEEPQNLKNIFNDQGIEAWILAELVEITHSDWANAVEGWLGNRRFALILDPEHFQTALDLYNAQPNSLAGVYLPNIAKLRKLAEKPRSGSLAEFVSSENPWAETYVKALLGNVMTSDTANLKNYEKAISQDCMSYADHTVRRIKKEVWGRHYLGRQAMEQRRQVLERDILRLEAELKEVGRAVNKAKEDLLLYTQAVQSLMEARHLAPALETVARLQEEIALLQQELDAIDISASVDLEKKRQDLSRILVDIREKRDALSSEVGRQKALLEGAIEHCDNQEDQLVLRQKALEVFSKEYSSELSELKQYVQGRLKAASPREIAGNYESARKGIESRSQNVLRKYRSSVSEYRSQSSSLVDVEIEAFPVLKETLERLERSQLPQYKERIIKARQDAEREFREHFIAKLNEYIIEAKESFKEINAILRTMSFGNDQYSFTLEERADRRGQIRLVQKAAEITSYDDGLFAQIVDPEERAETEKLFHRMLTVDLDSAEMRSICDYRTYFSYDIRIRDTHSLDPASGEPIVLSLSRVLREKSGGESQTPYYVAIAASFYRFFKDRKDRTIRFVLFDEAFDKLDDERIGKVVAFYAKMGIQLMMAVPPGKIEAIAPYMDQINIVYRLGRQASVREYQAETSWQPEPEVEEIDPMDVEEIHVEIHND